MNSHLEGGWRTALRWQQRPDFAIRNGCADQDTALGRGEAVPNERPQVVHCTRSKIIVADYSIQSPKIPIGLRCVDGVGPLQYQPGLGVSCPASIIHPAGKPKGLI